jgi:hypothetical protein
MGYKQLFIFVEGPDDERFINQIIKPLLLERYNHIKTIKYAAMTPKTVIGFIKTFDSQQNSDYIFMCDMDARGDTSLCITQRKTKEQIKFSSYPDSNKIIVVKEEIESWYLAGITSENRKKFNIKPFIGTDTVTKEEFEKIIPKNFGSKTDFMIEVLKEYSLNEAMHFNRSFHYFMSKHLPN